MTDSILNTTEDWRSQIQLQADLGTVWLTQLEMAELFQTTKQNIAKHLKGRPCTWTSTSAAINKRPHRPTSKTRPS